jgi:hypothetical protein
VQLISPCKCKGTLKYVHQGCLHKWQANVARLGGKRDERATVCGVCRSRYTSLPPKAALHVWRKVRSQPASQPASSSSLSASYAFDGAAVHVACLIKATADCYSLISAAAADTL